MTQQSALRSADPAGSPPGTVLHRLDEWVAATPEADAVHCAGRTLSYADLDLAANRLARALHEAGVGRDDRVGVVLDRTAELPVALLAVLRAGAGYLPVEPSYPDERIASSFAAGGVGVVLADEWHAARIAALAPHLRVFVPAGETTGETTGETAGRAERPAAAVRPDSLQYVIRTSGSTGRPKAIAMMHGPQARLVEWSRERYRAQARVLQYFPVTTDVASLEVFGTWGTGGTLVVATEAERYDIEALAALVERERVSRVLLPVAVLHQLAEQTAQDHARVASLVELVTTGERLTVTPALRAMVSALGPDACLDDHYGSSEVNVVVAPRLVQPAADWPDLPFLDTPMTGARVYVLDSRLGPAPRNVVGEIYVGGDPLARGYLGQGGATARAFVPDPFSPVPGTRMYRMGDLGRWRSGGRLEFMGRSDFQIKVHGYRVEPLEIEGLLTARPEVDRALAMLAGTADGEREALTAFVTAAGGAHLDPEDLRRAVSAALPSPMVPEAVVVLDEMPLLATGKVDRTRLPAPDLSVGAPVAPRNELEEAIAEVWCEVLGRDRVGVTDNFFSLGGHSLLVTRVVYELRDIFDVDIPLVAMFDAPTVAGLAGYVHEVLGGQA